MKQSWFEAQGEALWRDHEVLLGALESGGKHPRSAALPEEHARICSMLALARERRYTLGLKPALLHGEAPGVSPRTNRATAVARSKAALPERPQPTPTISASST